MLVACVRRCKLKKKDPQNNDVVSHLLTELLSNSQAGGLSKEFNNWSDLPQILTLSFNYRAVPCILSMNHAGSSSMLRTVFALIYHLIRWKHWTISVAVWFLYTSRWHSAWCFWWIVITSLHCVGQMSPLQNPSKNLPVLTQRGQEDRNTV